MESTKHHLVATWEKYPGSRWPAPPSCPAVELIVPVGATSAEDIERQLTALLLK